jgi:hypothetical protein
MEYASVFGSVQFARDPRGVDWRAFQHITIVNPRFWPQDLPLVIRQAHPAAALDRIPADTPEALQMVLSDRVYYGWRYGPQTDVDWAQLWPPGLTYIGLHGRTSGEMLDADFPVVAAARVEAVKITTHATLETVDRLRAIHPEMFILIRPIVDFVRDGEPRSISPAEFVRFTVPDLSRLYNYDPSLRFIEIHNEPNTPLEGLGGRWQDGADFGRWFLEVLHLYRALFPEARFGFPGLSPGPTTAGRQDSERFLAQAASAAQQADWIGMHAYWVNERELTDPRLGFNFVKYREQFPEKLLFLTEFGNPQQPKSEVALQYARYYGLLRHVPGLGAAFAYVVSTPDPVESPRWAWRDESGNDLGIAGVVGQRRFIR